MNRLGRPLALTAGLLLAGCYGRAQPRPGLRLEPAAFGLAGGQPAVVAFGAAWCEPCRSEIPRLNALARRFAGRADVRGFLVEGGSPGTTPDAAAVAGFRDAHGERPEYPVAEDSGWRRFDTLAAAGGRQLPLLAFIAGDGVVATLAQRSLDLEAEMVPLTDALLGGRSSSTPSPLPPPAMIWTGVGSWSAAPAHAPGTPAYANVEAGWETGLSAQGFGPTEMPFLDGSLAFLPGDAGDVPRQGHWTAVSGCEMTVAFNLDGSVGSTSGVCH